MYSSGQLLWATPLGNSSEQRCRVQVPSSNCKLCCECYNLKYLIVYDVLTYTLLSLRVTCTAKGGSDINLRSVLIGKHHRHIDVESLPCSLGL